MEVSLVVYLISLLFLLFFSALVSGSEVAFFSISKANIIKENNKNTRHIRKLINNPQKLLATILVANNFINIFIILIFAMFGNFLFEDLPNEIRFLIEIPLITFLILLFGEVLPKVYASRNPLSFAKIMSYPIIFLQIFFYPIVFVLTRFTNLISKKLNKKETSLSVETLSRAFELTSKEETTQQEKKILEGIMSFGNMEAGQVMTHRVDIIAVSLQDSFQVVLKKIKKYGHSRIPVYDEHLDQIKGILYSKDLLPHLKKECYEWERLIRDTIFTIPENRKLDDLFVDFQRKKQHLAIVVDEHGGTSGLVTLEDVFVKIVGDINGDFEDEDLNYSVIDEKNYLFKGKTSLQDFYKILDIEGNAFEVKKGNSETLAGFILEILRRFPKKREKITFGKFAFTIESLENRRIRRVKVTLL